MRSGDVVAIRDRFDPAVLRCRWTPEHGLARGELLAELRARSGWDAARVDALLWHGGLHLDGRPHGAETLPSTIAAGVRVDAYSFAREPAPVPLGAERILLERPDLVAVDKPAWLPTQATRATRRTTLEAALRALTGCPSLVAVHRLDRETSGVVLFARGADAAARLGAAFRAGATRKRYLALVSPVPARERFEVAGFLGRVLHPTRYAFALAHEPRPGWRASHTRFERIAANDGRALLTCAPTTGRTHQLRVHLAAAGAPIVGDALYGGSPAGRLQLHAAELGLTLDGEELLVCAPPCAGWVGC